jgi:hypothetical protein
VWRKNRHVNLSVFLASQFLVDTPLWLRQLTSVLFIRSISNAERQTVYRNFGHAFRSFAEFDQVLTQTTVQPGRSLVIDLRAPIGPGVRGAATKLGNAPRDGPRFPVGGPVGYYDYLPHSLMDLVVPTIAGKFTHPDVLRMLESRGDKDKYGALELVR